MPPKKKSGKKKSAKKSAPTRADQPLPEPLSDTTKEFYLVQIRDLEQRLARYQRKCDELEVGNGEFNKKFDQLITDKKEIVAFWKRQVEQRTDEIADLNDRLVGLQQAKDSEKEVYEGQLQQLRGEFQETRDQLTSENMILGGKLASLEEFKVQKEDLMAKFESMEKLLKENDDAHDNTIYGLERKAVIDKDRLKKEMVLRVNQVAAEFRKVSNKQMAETTKRTIRENVSINSQLAKMSDKTVEIIEENDNLRVRDKTQRRQIELLEANEKELAKKNYSNQKIIRMLTDKCRHQEAIILELEETKKETNAALQELEIMKLELQNEKEMGHEIKEELEKSWADIQLMSSSLEKERKERLKIESVLKETSDAIKVALRMEDTDELGRKIDARDAMLENILVLMNSAAAIGVGVDPIELGAVYTMKRPTKFAKIPGSGKGIRKGEMEKSPIANAVGVSHYKLGDLGLIPRPQQNIPSTVEKMRMLSATTRLGQLKKVLTKSIACQTTSIPKAMFFADQIKTSVSSNSVLRPVYANKKTVKVS